MSLLVPAYPGCPGSKAVKRSLLLLLLNYPKIAKLCPARKSAQHLPPVLLAAFANVFLPHFYIFYSILSIFYICGSNEGVYEVNCYFHSINSFCSSGSSQSFLHMANYTWLTVTGCDRGKITPPPTAFWLHILTGLQVF